MGRNTNQPLTILKLSTWTLKLKNSAKNFSASGRNINAINVNDQLYELGTIIKNVIQRLDDLNLKWNISILTSVSWNFFYIIFVLLKLTYLRRPLYLRNKRERPLVKSSMRREQIVKLKILNA